MASVEQLGVSLSGVREANLTRLLSVVLNMPSLPAAGSAVRCVLPVLTAHLGPNILFMVKGPG